MIEEIGLLPQIFPMDPLLQYYGTVKFRDGPLQRRFRFYNIYLF